MRLYYTVSSGYNDPQSKLVNSLGGFKSSTPVPNDQDNNVFDELSLLSLVKGKTQYIGLILKNELGVEVKNVQLWFETPEGSYGSFQLAAVQTDKNNEGQPFFETIPDIFSKPFYAEFHQATELDKATIGDMEIDQEIGLWLCRSIDKKTVIEDYNNVAEKDTATENRYKPIEKATEESIAFQISWE